MTAFQRFADASYPRLPGYEMPSRRNAFQNISEGDQLWSAAGGTSYSAILDGRELADLQRLFQQRHLLAHSQGIVDADYLAKSDDKTYTVGQRLVVREPAVKRLADLVEKLAAGLRADIQGTPLPNRSYSTSNESGRTASLPRVAGTTTTDMRVYQLACEHGLATGNDHIRGEHLWHFAEAQGISRTEFLDAIGILTSKHLVTA